MFIWMPLSGKKDFVTIIGKKVIENVDFRVDALGFV